MARPKRGSQRTPEAPALFDDLPLRTRATVEVESEPARPPRPAKAAAPAFEPDFTPDLGSDLLPLEEPPQRFPKAVPSPPPSERGARPAARIDEGVIDEPAPRGSRSRARWLGGAADTLVHGGILVIALVGCRGLAVHPDLDLWPPFALFVLSFSFLYTAIPLAFWGQTPGMAWSGVIARDRDGASLTFDQTARRWLGGLVSAALLGLPVFLAWKGRSLTDWVSGSQTLWESEDEGPLPEGEIA